MEPPITRAALRFGRNREVAVCTKRIVFPHAQNLHAVDGAIIPPDLSAACLKAEAASCARTILRRLGLQRRGRLAPR